MDLPVRRAVSSDVAALHALVQRCYRGDEARRGWTHEADLLGGQRIDAPALAAIVADPAQEILVAADGGAVAGCVQIADQGGGRARLGLLSVDPGQQAAGLGTRLIQAAEQEATARFAATHMEMTVIAQRTELIAYYGRRGYAPTGEARPFPLDDPRFGLPMRRDLAFAVLVKTLV